MFLLLSKDNLALKNERNIIYNKYYYWIKYLLSFIADYFSCFSWGILNFTMLSCSVLFYTYLRLRFRFYCYVAIAECLMRNYILIWRFERSKIWYAVMMKKIWYSYDMIIYDASQVELHLSVSVWWLSQYMLFYEKCDEKQN